MAFGGIGTVGQLVGITAGVELVSGGDFALNPRGRYVQFGANGEPTGVALGLPNDDDRFWRKGIATAPNTDIPMEERGALQSLLIRAVGGDGDALLAPCDDNPAPDPINGNTAEIGILSTAAPDGLTPPVSGRHFLPANFGKGRGNWVADDIARIRVEFWISAVGCAIDDQGVVISGIELNVIEIRPIPLAGPVLDGYGRSLGDLEIVVINRGNGSVPSGSAIVLTSLHSIGL